MKFTIPQRVLLEAGQGFRYNFKGLSEEGIDLLLKVKDQELKAVNVTYAAALGDKVALEVAPRLPGGFNTEFTTRFAAAVRRERGIEWIMEIIDRCDFPTEAINAFILEMALQAVKDDPFYRKLVRKAFTDPDGALSQLNEHRQTTQIMCSYCGQRMKACPFCQLQLTRQVQGGASSRNERCIKCCKDHFDPTDIRWLEHFEASILDVITFFKEIETGPPHIDRIKSIINNLHDTKLPTKDLTSLRKSQRAVTARWMSSTLIAMLLQR